MDLSYKKAYCPERLREPQRIYAFTTENIAGYFPDVVEGRKKILTVAASGDHLINSALLGATDITAFDRNSAALYWSELKLVGLGNLELKDYLDFFNETLNYEIYKTLSDKLTDKARSFFDRKFNFYDNNGRKIRNHISIFFETTNRPAEELNLYLKNDSYKKAQSVLPNTSVKLMHSCINDIPQNIGEEKFDSMIISNILDYMCNDGWTEPVEIIKKFEKCCKTIQCTYDYAGRNETDVQGTFEELCKKYSGHNVRLKKIPTAWQNASREFKSDRVITLDYPQ